MALVTEAGDKRVLNLFLTSLKSGNRELAGANLDGIIAQNTPNAGKLLATIRRKMPSLRRIAATRVPLLGDEAYRAYLDALSKEERDKARTEAFGALLGIAPDFVEALTRAGTARGMSAQGNSAAPPADDGEAEPLSCRKPGFFARLFGSRKKSLEKLLPKFRNLRDLDLICSKVESMEIDGRELTGAGPGRVFLSRDGVHPQQGRREQPAVVRLQQLRGHGMHVQLREFLGNRLRGHGLCQLLVQRLQFHGNRLCQL